MPWVRFSERFEWRPHPRQVVVYKPAMECMVTTPCATAALTADKAVKIDAPNLDEAERIRRYQRTKRHVRRS